MLDDFGQQVDGTGDKLKKGLRRVQWIIKKNEGWEYIVDIKNTYDA